MWTILVDPDNSHKLGYHRDWCAALYPVQWFTWQLDWPITKRFHERSTVFSTEILWTYSVNDCGSNRTSNRSRAVNFPSVFLKCIISSKRFARVLPFWWGLGGWTSHEDDAWHKRRHQVVKMQIAAGRKSETFVMLSLDPVCTTSRERLIFICTWSYHTHVSHSNNWRSKESIILCVRNETFSLSDSKLFLNGCGKQNQHKEKRNWRRSLGVGIPSVCQGFMKIWRTTTSKVE